MGDCNLRPIIENGYKMVEKYQLPVFLKTKQSAWKKTEKDFFPNGTVDECLYFIAKNETVSVLSWHSINWEQCRIRMYRIMDEAVLRSFQSWLQNVLYTLKAFVERQWPKVCMNSTVFVK